MIQSEQHSRIYQSYNPPYYTQNTQQTFRPSNKQQKQYSPFQSLSEQMFKLPQNQSILYQKSSYFQNQQNFRPQSYSQEIIPIKEYWQKPFGKIPQFKINDIQIVIPSPTARFQLNASQSYYTYQKDEINKSPRGGIKKKKITIVTKTLTPKSQKV